MVMPTTVRVIVCLRPILRRDRALRWGVSKKEVQPVCKLPKQERPYHHAGHEGWHCALSDWWFADTWISSLEHHLAFVVEVADKTPFWYYARGPSVFYIESERCTGVPVRCTIRYNSTDWDLKYTTNKTGDTSRTWHYQSRHFRAVCLLCSCRKKAPQN